MTTVFLIILSLLIGYAAGFYSGVKNAKSSKVALAKDIADKFKK